MIPKVFLLMQKCKEVNNCSNQTQLLYRGYKILNRGVSANHRPKPPDATLTETYTQPFGLPIPPCALAPLSGAPTGADYRCRRGEAPGDGGGARERVRTWRGGCSQRCRGNAKQRTFGKEPPRPVSENRPTLERDKKSAAGRK